MSIDLDFDLIIDNLPLLLKGAAVTLEITALSVGIGLLIGMVVGIARPSNFKAIRWLAGIYVDLYSRNTAVGPNLLGLLCSSKNLRDENGPIFCGRRELVPSIAVPMLPKSSEAASRVLTRTVRSFPCIWVLTGSSQWSLSLCLRHLRESSASWQWIHCNVERFFSRVRYRFRRELTRTGQMIISRTYAVFEVWMVVAILYLIMTLCIFQASCRFGKAF